MNKQWGTIIVVVLVLVALLYGWAVWLASQEAQTQMALRQAVCEDALVQRQNAQEALLRTTVVTGGSSSRVVPSLTEQQRIGAQNTVTWANEIIQQYCK